MNNQNIRHALSKIAWAYLLILLNFRINDLDLLPNWAGYLLIFLAIGQLSGELRNLPLLKPFCILLGIAAGVDWLALPLSGAELTGRRGPECHLGPLLRSRDAGRHRQLLRRSV